MRDLKELRVEIDRIDREMVALFEERMGISKEVAEYKIATGKKILDKERENQKIEAVKALTHNDFNGHGVEELYKQIMGISRKLQYQLMEEKALGRLPFIMVDELEKKNVRVVYQGVEGAYAQQAMFAFFGGCEPFPCGAVAGRHGRHCGRYGGLRSAAHREFHGGYCQ